MATYHEVRPDIIDSILRYAEHGVPTGSFLRAVLENDLREAFGRADDDNRDAMFHIVRYCWNEIPGECWGSPARVTAWIAKHQPRTAFPMREGKLGATTPGETLGQE